MFVMTRRLDGGGSIWNYDGFDSIQHVGFEIQLFGSGSITLITYDLGDFGVLTTYSLTEFGYLMYNFSFFQNY